MKKIKFLSMLLISIIFYNCENYDDNVTKAPTNIVKNDLTTALNNQRIISNPFNTDSYIKNPEDLDDEKIQKQLLNLGLLSRKLFKDGSFSSIIISNAKKNQSGAIRFSTLLSKINPEEDNYAEIRNFIQNMDLTHRSQNAYNRGTTENYDPAIFVPNILVADPTLQPIISSGIAVNSELPELVMYEDYIVSWYYDNGNWVEFLMSEEMSQNTTTPVFIVDNADSNTLNQMLAIDDGDIYSDGGGGSGNGGGSGTGSGSGNNTTSNYQNYYSHRYKINHRYESWGKSELYITGGHIGQSYSFGNTTAHTYGLYSTSTGIFSTRKKLASVRRSWIGDWRWHFQKQSDGTFANFTFWNTYERDWYRSFKWLGSPSRYGASLYLKGRRAYQSQWYAYEPGQVTNNPLVKTSSKYYTNSKSGLLVENQ